VAHYARSRCSCSRSAVAGALALSVAVIPIGRASAQSGAPIKIGYSMSLTGGLAPNGRSALLAQQIWEEDTNAKGGILGRSVKLIHYDDKSSPSEIPSIYTKLLDIDKVDLIIGAYGTALTAPAMPIVIQRKKTFIGLLGLAVNSQFNYPNYFAMGPYGPDAKSAFTKGFFDAVLSQTARPQTVAIVAADQEFSRNAADGARENMKQSGLRLVYERAYPPTTVDFAPIVRSVAAASPDLVVVCSYPPDSVGMVRAVNELGFKPKAIGGAMVGLQSPSVKMQLGPLLNGFINYEFWLPVPKMQFPGVADLISRYQARAAAEGVDPLGYYMPPWAYAQLQILQQAVEATKNLDDVELGKYIRAHSFSTVVGDVEFGPQGEWAQSRVLQVQYQNIRRNDLAQFKDMSTQLVVAPPEYASGQPVYPYERAK
jgi:branched-chain amino acid transport system substrate-binding protein